MPDSSIVTNDRNDDGLVPEPSLPADDPGPSTGEEDLDPWAPEPIVPSTYDTSLTSTSLPHKSIAQAGVQISRTNVTWASSFGGAASVSYGFRITKPSYNTTSNTVGTFLPFTSGQIAATLTIAALWSDLANINLVRIGSGTTGSGAYNDSATILLSDYTSTTDGSGAFAIGGVSAKATAGSSAAGDIYDNLAYNSTAPSIGTYSWMTLVHEFGHAIGLSHPGDYNAQPGVNITYGDYAQYFEDSQQYSVMSYFSAANTGASYNGVYPLTPMLDDIAALQRIYGANTSTRAGNTTYGFNSNADRDVYKLTSASDQRVMTLYDAGGVDTLDLSGYSANQSINLNPGSYSNAGGLKLNLAIADGTVIENAIGGSGNDVIYANAANNVIDGAAGSDTVVYPGPRSDYRVSRSGTVLTVTDSNLARGGTDTLFNIEALSFSDQDVAASAVDPPSFAIAAIDMAKKEGNSGTTIFNYTLTRTGDSSAAVVTYTVTGTGANPASANDFVGGVFPSGVMSFAAGQTSSGLVIGVAGDTAVEPDETFMVTLSGAGLAFTTASAVSTILNDDAVAVTPASFAIAATDAVKKEGNSGTTTFAYTVTRSGDTSAQTSLAYTVAGSGANPATASDFVGSVLPSGTLTFAAGETSRTVTIAVAGDTTVEPDETFAVTLSGAGLTFSTASASGTIQNDDAVAVTVAPATFAIAAADATKKEGNSGTTPFTFTITRSGDTSGSANLGYNFTGSGKNAADASDFPPTGLFYNAVSFSPGDVTKTITVYVNGDTTFEPDETFTVTLTGDSYATITTSTATGTILNDDAAGPLLGVQNKQTGAGSAVNMDVADPGGPSYLANQYIYFGSDDLAIATSAPSVFIHSGSGNDAIQVTSGRNVLDGGLGSNFLTGGTGADTFFTDARNPGTVWNTIRNFHQDSAATLWGFVPGVSSYRWEAGLAGAAGAEGATLRANIVGGKGRLGDGVDASITFSGLSVAQAQKLQIVTGSTGTASYLYVYNPGV